MDKQRTAGAYMAIVAYVIWGVFPAYWRLLESVPALQLLSHRIVWSCVLIAFIVAFTGRWADLRLRVADHRVLLVYSGAAALIGVNWFVYVWAVNAGHIVETSLGYFINPLISVLLGVVFLREQLRPGQWAAILLAAGGVVYLTVSLGRLPWIALTLAASFALYGLVKKVAPLAAVEGLALETGLLLLPALGYLVWVMSKGTASFPSPNVTTDLLLVGAGVVTTVPLLMFAFAARRIPLFWVGLFQYIAPTIQFALGVFIYHEQVSAQRLIGFCIVWAALGVFAGEGLLAPRGIAGKVGAGVEVEAEA